MKKIFLLGTAVPLLFLCACGDGWETRPYNNTPYGTRTAGSGVEYVRAVMMREKGPVLRMEEPEEPVVIMPEPEPEPVMEEPEDPMITDGEKFFRNLQKK